MGNNSKHIIGLLLTENCDFPHPPNYRLRNTTYFNRVMYLVRRKCRDPDTVVQHGSAHNPVWALTTQPTSYVKPWKRVLFSNNSWYCLLSLIIKSHEVNTEHTERSTSPRPVLTPTTRFKSSTKLSLRICQIQTVPNKSSSFLEIPFFRGGKGWKLHDELLALAVGFIYPGSLDYISYIQYITNYWMANNNEIGSILLKLQHVHQQLKK